jgi:hypothetical protein
MRGEGTVLARRAGPRNRARRHWSALRLISGVRMALGDVSLGMLGASNAAFSVA